MSLQIDYERVAAVMITGEWYTVKPGSFYTDAYEFGYYVPDDDYRDGRAYHCDHGGGQSGVCATGFEFTQTQSHGTWYTQTKVFGPLTSIQAVRYKSETHDMPVPPLPPSSVMAPTAIERIATR